jgi:hypothetical protein
MSSVTTIRAHLDLIRQNLLQHPIFTRGAGVPVDDPAYKEETRRLYELSQKLEILVRELKNRRHLLSAQEQALSKIPREQRYSPKSLISDQQRSVDELLRTSAQAQKQIEDLIRKSGLLTAGELDKGVGELIGQLFNQSGDGGTLLPSPHPAYKHLLPGQFNESPEAAAMAVLVGLRVLIHLCKRTNTAAA